MKPTRKSKTKTKIKPKVKLKVKTKIKSKLKVRPKSKLKAKLKKKKPIVLKQPAVPNVVDTEINALEMERVLYVVPPLEESKPQESLEFIEDEPEEPSFVPGSEVKLSSQPAITQFRGPYFYLSNFWISPVPYEGLIYKSAEHAFQAAKTSRPDIRRQIASLFRPADAKHFGKTIPLRPDWDLIKYDVMRAIVRSKFSDPRLGLRLVATGDAELIESNTWGDTTWGVFEGRGSNWLGKILMEVREELRAQRKRGQNE